MSAVWFKRLNIHKAHEKPFLNDFGANIRKSAIHWWSISETRSPLSPWEENEGVSWQPIAWTPFAILQASDFVFLEGQCDLLMLPGFAHPTSVSMLPQNKHIGIVSAHSLRWQVSFQEKFPLRKWKYSFFTKMTMQYIIDIISTLNCECFYSRFLSLFCCALLLNTNIWSIFILEFFWEQKALSDIRWVLVVSLLH